MPITPMMQQYLQIKEQNPEALLLFRLGDFYEMFFDDALVVSRELELTLTGKDCGLNERAPMCGVPYHAVDTYIARLIEKGYKVAICDQMSDPAESKGLVERAITRIVTPGTVTDGVMLDEKRPNYILSLCLSKDRAGIAFCELSTGEFFLYQITGAQNRLVDELSRIAPREMLLAEPDAFSAFASRNAVALTKTDQSSFDYADAAALLSRHFGGKRLSELGVEGMKLAVSAAGALMRYLSDTQKNALEHIERLTVYQPERYMMLDQNARQSLELTESMRGRSRRGSLLWLLDQSMTSMGGRLLRSWIEQPLIIPAEIEARLDAVEELVSDAMGRETIRETLKPVRDVERLLSRIAYGAVNARDCLALLASLDMAPKLRALIEDRRAALFANMRVLLTPLDDIAELLTRAINPDAPLSVREGDIIRDGYREELDELRAAGVNGKKWLSELEAREREETGIKSLKVGYNRVFGFYIEVTKSYYGLVPMRYIRKQTLASCERFITQELKELEKKVLGAEDSALRLEYQLFVEIREQLARALPRFADLAQGMKLLDAVAALAQTSAMNDYVRPKFNEEGCYRIEAGRHPVVEASIGRERFVANDTHLDARERIMIITGPNMAGKSTYMRQVAQIVLMAHIGCFVPARSAEIAITDRIFTRIGASDDLYGGQSTFMVEMSEMATILRYATPRSLLILDEVGRGTSTFDGLSIAWAAVEYISQKCGARTLFATHYHELSELEGQLEGVVDYRITVREQGEEIIFLRQIVRGGADRSYGVAVAGLAGLPSSLIHRARQIMARLEVNDEARGGIAKSILDKRKNAGNKQVEMTDFPAMELVEEVRAMDVMSMSPIDALNALFLLSEKARRI